MSTITLGRLISQSLFLASLLLTGAKATAASVDVVYPVGDSKGGELQISATVEAVQHSQLATQQAGLLAELFVEVGDKVESGAPLLALDSELAKLELNEARASLKAAEVAQEEAERLYKELKALASKKFVAATRISERRAQLAQSQAELSRQQASLAIREEQLRRHTLYAPFDGIIAQRLVNIGEWVNQQSAVLSLVQGDALRLKLAIPQEYFQQLQLGAEVSITADHDNRKTLNAHIDRIVPVSDNQSRAFVAYITIPDNAGLNVGMSAIVNIALSDESTQRLWLPKSAIKQHPDGGASVFAVENGKAQRHIIQIEEQESERVAITGAPAGKAYVKSGVELLQDGDELTIARSKEPGQ
ncbi:efflux RND transporter periplasmic adaptor subunit [Pseudoteredinibacter isoporae]|uniref:RND family efflux transporter MFP subunit n=1 Tax=Pseudoteredinibacter isoporae TaxID=570281 RepID=A0A7X0JUA5_9GAMM|nr:efflux RND transporter periplasmic adaptor subunit [Pseudoteredinibacter isoporae]MBB6521828.1 RND family efflux transporter MFP subunit [Pseudoteredinibacter isoporae]NHO87373.1 efflux RND transporter periplasmic adaptor subunit [Pseudoteredinibacter isoporae]NIB23197.1 efflux RND transporter periplasmic adaptor subunit [Pseudoteredinibacter isoporae]